IFLIFAALRWSLSPARRPACGRDLAGTPQFFQFFGGFMAHPPRVCVFSFWRRYSGVPAIASGGARDPLGGDPLICPRLCSNVLIPPGGGRGGGAVACLYGAAIAPGR